eukprot:5970723-Prymnesium_polylepis.1
MDPHRIRSRKMDPHRIPSREWTRTGSQAEKWTRTGSRVEMDPHRIPGRKNGLACDPIRGVTRVHRRGLQNLSFIGGPAQVLITGCVAHKLGTGCVAHKLARCRARSAEPSTHTLGEMRNRARSARRREGWGGV